MGRACRKTEVGGKGGMTIKELFRKVDFSNNHLLYGIRVLLVIIVVLRFVWLSLGIIIVLLPIGLALASKVIVIKQAYSNITAKIARFFFVRRIILWHYYSLLWFIF
jgi:hypothetical protein